MYDNGTLGEIWQISTNLEQNLSFKSALLFPTVSMQRRLFILLVHSLFFTLPFSTNSVATIVFNLNQIQAVIPLFALIKDSKRQL